MGDFYLKFIEKDFKSIHPVFKLNYQFEVLMEDKKVVDI